MFSHHAAAAVFLFLTFKPSELMITGDGTGFRTGPACISLLFSLMISVPKLGVKGSGIVGSGLWMSMKCLKDSAYWDWKKGCSGPLWASGHVFLACAQKWDSTWEVGFAATMALVLSILAVSLVPGG